MQSSPYLPDHTHQVQLTLLLRIELFYLKTFKSDQLERSFSFHALSRLLKVPRNTGCSRDLPGGQTPYYRPVQGNNDVICFFPLTSPCQCSIGAAYSHYILFIVATYKVEQNLIYSCEYMRQFTLVLLFIHFYIFHMNNIACIYHILFIHLYIYGLLGGFYLLAICE